MSEAPHTVTKEVKSKEQRDADLREEYNGENIATAEIAKDRARGGGKNRVDSIRETHMRLRQEAALYDVGATEAERRTAALRFEANLNSRIEAENSKLEKARAELRGEVKEGDGKREDLDKKLIETREKQLAAMKAAQERVKMLEKEKKDWAAVDPKDRRKYMGAKLAKIQNAIDHLEIFDEKDTPIKKRVYEDRAYFEEDSEGNNIGPLEVEHADGSTRQMVVEAPEVGGGAASSSETGPKTERERLLAKMRKTITGRSGSERPDTGSSESDTEGSGVSSEDGGKALSDVLTRAMSGDSVLKLEVNAALFDFVESVPKEELVSRFVQTYLNAMVNKELAAEDAAGGRKSKSGPEVKPEMFNLVSLQLKGHIRRRFGDPKNVVDLSAILKNMPSIVAQAKNDSKIGFHPISAVFGRRDDARVGKYRAAEGFFEVLEESADKVSKIA